MTPCLILLSEGRWRCSLLPLFTECFVLERGKKEADESCLLRFFFRECVSKIKGDEKKKKKTKKKSEKHRALLKKKNREKEASRSAVVLTAKEKQEKKTGEKKTIALLMFSCFKFVYLTVALFIHAAARLFLDFQAGGKAAQAGTSLNKQKQERTVEIKNQK